MPVQQTASVPWDDLPNEIWVNIFKFLPASQDWRNLVNVNKIFGELIKENFLTAGYVESKNPKDIPFTFTIFKALGGTETGLRIATKHFCENPEYFKEFWDHFLPLTKTLNEIEKGAFRYQGAFGESFETAKQTILKYKYSERSFAVYGHKLSFAKMNLSFLPRKIASLTELEHLDLTHNKLIKIPSGLSQMKALQGLYLSYNQITKVDPEIFQMINLEMLSLDNNQLPGLPSQIGQLPDFWFLKLSFNKLREIPSEIVQLKELKRLYLNNNDLKALLPEISQLKELTILDLSYNMLTSLPPEIGQLKKLTTLRLIGNPLSDKEKENIQAWFEGTKVQISF